MSIHNLIHKFASDGIIDQQEYTTLSVLAKSMGLEKSDILDTIKQRGLIVGDPIQTSLDMRCVENMVANEHNAVSFKIRLRPLIIGTITKIDVICQISSSQEVSIKTITQPEVNSLYELSVPIYPKEAGFNNLYIWIKLQTNNNGTVWFALPTPLSVNITAKNNRSITLSNKKGPANTSVPENTFNHFVQSAIWDSIEFISQDFATAHQFFASIAPNVIQKQLSLHNSFGGTPITHIYIGHAMNLERLGFCVHTKGKQYSFGHMGYADFFSMDDPKEKFMEYIDPIHCVFDPQNNTLLDQNTLNGTQIIDSPDPKSPIISEKGTTVNLAGKVKLSFTKLQNNGSFEGIWQIIQQSTSFVQKFHLMDDDHSLSYTIQDGLFLASNSLGTQKHFSIVTINSNLYIINDSLQTMEFSLLPEYDAINFQLFPNEGVLLTNQTPQYIRIDNHCFHLQLYKITKIVDTNTGYPVKFHTQSPRSVLANLLPGQRFMEHFSIMRQIGHYELYNTYLCNNILSNVEYVLQVFSLHIHEQMYHHVQQNIRILQQITGIAQMEMQNLMHTPSYCLWANIHQNPISIYTKTIEEKLVYIRQITETAIILQANNFTEFIIQPFHVYKKGEQIVIGGWIEHLLYQQSPFAMPSSTASDEQPLVDSLLRTIAVLFDTKPHAISDVRNIPAADLLLLIPAQFELLRKMFYQQIITKNKHIFIRDILETLQISTVEKANTVDRINTLMNLASLHGISIHISADATEEEIEKYDKLLQKVAQNKAVNSTKPTVETPRGQTITNIPQNSAVNSGKPTVEITNAQTITNYEMIFIGSGGFVKDIGSIKQMIKITKSFLVSNILVTEKLYSSLIPTYRNNTPNRPVVNVSWLDAIRFCNLLSESIGLEPTYRIKPNGEVVWRKNNNGFRLLTEAEWELCVRANTKVQKTIWAQSNSTTELPDVGIQEANGFGIYDMLGLVWEWCWDVFEPLKSGSFQNPIVEQPGKHTRVVRGGAINESIASISIHSRNGHAEDYVDPWIGIRVCRDR